MMGSIRPNLYSALSPHFIPPLSIFFLNAHNNNKRKEHGPLQDNRFGAFKATPTPPIFWIKI